MAHETVLLTGTFTRLDGSPASGSVKITPSRSPIMDPDLGVVVSGPQIFPLDSEGKLSVSLPATNDTSLGEAFTYSVDADLAHGSWVLRGLTLPTGSGTVDLADPPSGVSREYPTRAEWEQIVAGPRDELERAERLLDDVRAPITEASWSGAVTVPANPGIIRATLTGDTTLTLPPGGAEVVTVTLDITQDTVGGRTLTIPGVLSAWATQVVPHQAANSRTLIHVTWLGDAWLALVAAQNIGLAASGGV